MAVIGSSMFKGLSANESGKIILLVAHDGLPTIVGCVLIASVVAIIVSTATSFLLVPSTNIMRDIWQRFINPELSQKKIVLYSRLTVILLGLAAYILIEFYPRVLNAAYAAYTVYGAGITPALIATFFWKRATPTAGAVSIFGGMLVTIVWEVLSKISSESFLGFPAIYPALITSVLLLIVISLVQAPPDSEKWKPFFKEKSQAV